MTEATTCDTAGTTEQQSPGVQNYTDGYSYEVPRPFLTLQQAAGVLGMTLRSIERSVLARWGSTKLPDGWVARKMKTGGGDEWRILPPPGFRVKLNAATEYDTVEPSDSEPVGVASEVISPPPSAKSPSDPLGYYLNNRRRLPKRQERQTIDHPTIVIDRTEEVEHLLRELVSTKSALAEERRVHLEDMRMIAQLQGSMRLLEVNAVEQAKAKTELESAKQELQELKSKYNELVSAPWWRRMFKK